MHTTSVRPFITRRRHGGPGRWETVNPSGNLSTDGLIALHAMGTSATIYSNDRDCDRFPGVHHVNPLKGT